MYSQKEFNDWIKSFAEVTVTIPQESDMLVYDINAPADGLVLRVDPKIGLDGEWKGGSPEVRFVGKSGDVSHVETVANVENWQINLKEVIMNAMREWRDIMIS